MQLYLEAKRADLKRRRRERYIIIGLILCIALLSTYLGVNLSDLGLELTTSNSILIYALINLNVILLLLLLYLTMRNLVKLLFERKMGIMGAKLRTKLVLAFITLSLLPTIILFFVSVQFIATSIEYWFNLPIEKSLKNSLEVGQDFYDGVAREIISYGNNVSRLLTYHGYMLVARKDEAEKFITEKRVEYSLASIKVFSKRMELRAVSDDDSIDLRHTVFSPWRPGHWDRSHFFEDRIEGCGWPHCLGEIYSGCLCKQIKHPGERPGRV
jgi:two-component system nitrogen regulation sensor histidine kinase NtrY